MSIAGGRSVAKSSPMLRFFNRELEYLFPRSWLFVGHASQVSAPGQFFSSRMGSDPVLLTRDAQGGVNVLLNSCRHRGMAVCRYDEGRALQFTCPYHGWSYSMDGSLVSTPPGGFARCAAAGHGLRQRP